MESKALILPGRWTTYRFVFENTDNPNNPYSQMLQALQDYNINIVSVGHLDILKSLPAPVWDFLDKSPATQKGSTASPLQPNDDSVWHLAFEVRYQLEVCISNGYLNEYTISPEFISGLMSIRASEARDILEYVANQGKPVPDPMSLFKIKVVDGALLRAKIPHYCVFIRSVTITPTAVYFQTPVPETSNRVIRRYSHYSDRFLRVRFTDEKTEV